MRGRTRFAERLDLDFGGTTWRALPQLAALWLPPRWLVVADLHFGKAATFRARGVPVPGGTTEAGLARLTALIEQTRPRRLVFLGDLLHAREAHGAGTMQQLARWRAQHAALPMTLVEGNHDRHAGAPPPALSIDVVDEPWTMQGIAFCHHPQRIANTAVVAGHLHPCVRLHGAANDTLRLPCFWQRVDLLTLPAFGEFTGGAPIQRERGDRVFAVADAGLIEIPAAALTV
ncbi:MAG: ligase-associated DNA damage response endonuclease PdeM [Burkholderiales bacterium]|jgi:DNA ligase-associated metallophosphoesterase|nr:ligase-associated DNA damage response endonuclease PdeM [Burkholderiales bacterium]